MEVPSELITAAGQIAARVACRCQLDPMTTQSIVGELAVRVSADAETVDQCFQFFYYAVKRTLVNRVLDELTIYGPKSGARRQRRLRKQNDTAARCRPLEVSPPAKAGGINMVDFLDEFQGSPKLCEFVLLLMAGYTQRELIDDFGYTRRQVENLKKDVADVYEKSRAD